MRKKERIVEVYFHRPLLTRKNPLGGKKRMRVAGGCLIGISEGKGPIKWMGAGTVKLIPMSRKGLKSVSKAPKRARKKKTAFVGTMNFFAKAESDAQNMIEEAFR